MPAILDPGKADSIADQEQSKGRGRSVGRVADAKPIGAADSRKLDRYHLRRSGVSRASAAMG